MTALALTALTSTSGAAQTAAVDTLRVDLGSPTGAFHGGATGILYGLGDPGVPSHDLIAGMRPRTVSQKAPGGEQHPGGDALVVADAFFAAGGTDVHIYAQDVYSAWPYQDLGIDDYIARLRPQLEKVAARPDRDRFVWTIFNEPDWIWYGDWAADKERFFADWTRVHRLVKSVLPDARITGPGETRYRADHLREFLAHAKAEDVLPDIVTWHELGPESLTTYRGHYEDYRAIERSLGLPPRPININEYSNRRDTSVPGQMIQWITMLEDTKVDGQMAFWTMAGNLSDHAVRAGRANGGWWLTKWYADLSGETVRVTPPRPSTRDTLQGLATVDRADARATVLLGGTANPVEVALTGLDRRLFGSRVDVRIARTTWSGYEGDAGQPPVVAASRLRVVDGEVTLAVPGGDPLAAYQVVITKAGHGAPPAADAPWQASHEAESGTVEQAVVVTQDDGSGSDDMAQRYTTSGGKDVGSMKQPGSAVTVEVDVPRDGAYRLGVF
ncbi:MAG: cellulosome protein, partial [Saccharothrix sp.]|nr:cellulosome protein [Saccharothrix sp.]